MEAFLKFIAEIMEISEEKITLLTTQDDLEEWNSLMQLRLVAEIEEKYKVSIPLEDISNIKTVGKFYNYIR
ncbi:MAG: acyl carrier protein [Lachnospiraceae bacterium]